MPLYSNLPNSNALTATRNGPRSWEAPFADITDELVFREDYIQDAAAYVPAALDSIHPEINDAYLVNEGARTNIGGFYKWTRTYAKIPPSRQVYESYAWLVPGIGSGAVYAAQSISGVVVSSGVSVVTASSSPTIAEGDSCSISYTFTDSVTGTQYGRHVIRTALSGTSGTTIKVDLIAEPGGTLTFLTIKKVEAGRAAESLEVGSVQQVDYFLPGVSPGVTTPLDIPIIACLEIYDGDGVKTNSFTADTSPTITEWRAQVAASDNVCVVRSVVRRWQGNIYERTTRYCVAQ